MQIYARRQPGTLNVEVFVYQEPGPSMGSVGSYIQFDAGNVIQTLITRTGSDQDIKPAFTIPELLFREMTAAFADHAHQIGIENKTESFVGGKLDATERHLADLRTLLKLKAN